MKLPWQKKEGTEEYEVTLPDELKTKLDGAASKEDVTALKTTLDKLQESMKAISDHTAAEAEERRKAAAKKAAEESTNRQAATDEELTELALIDPVAAMKRVVQEAQSGRDAALMTINAANLRREVFEDSAKYPFYTGKIKEEVDKLLATQSLKAQNDRTTIEHAYHSMVGQNYKEISEGKLKDRFASSESNRGSNGHVQEPEKKGPRVMTDDEKRAARTLGFKDEEYGKLLDEEGVGYV